MQDPGGWGSIADRPEWGLFKFGHTHPNKSNSGLLTLALMAYGFSKKHRELTAADIADPRFQAWLRNFERSVTRQRGSADGKLGNDMREMVLRGPSQYDCLMLYENLAVDYLERGPRPLGRPLRVYPGRISGNDHPYYILDIPEKQRPSAGSVAGRFLEFLLSEPTQR